VTRPVYIGVGTCNCKRTEVRLFQVPGDKPYPSLMCGKCLEANGLEVPIPRTAEDIEVVNGVMQWKQ
jgi:hypothetical protein